MRAAFGPRPTLNRHTGYPGGVKSFLDKSFLRQFFELATRQSFFFMATKEQRDEYILAVNMLREPVEAFIDSEPLTTDENNIPTDYPKYNTSE